MTRSRGSVLLITLASGLVLLTLSLPCLHYLWRNALRQSEYIRWAQVRMLTYGEMAQLINSEPDGVLTESHNVGVLQPGGAPVTLHKEVRFTEDNVFRLCEAGARTDDYSFVMNQMTFTPSVKVQERAGSEIFSSLGGFGSTPKNYYKDLPTSTGSHFNPINTFDLEKDYRRYESDDMTIFRQLGFGGLIYSCKGNLTFPEDEFLGDAMFVIDKGTLTISEGARFTGRTVFLVQNSASVSIGKNVKMADAFILCSGNIDIGAGCELTGHFRSNTTIKINGKGTFNLKTDAGRPFHSVAYVWD